MQIPLLSLGAALIGTLLVISACTSEELPVATTQTPDPLPWHDLPAEGPINLTPEQWQARLSPEAYQVLRRHGTERPFTCGLLNNPAVGTYHCAGCGNPLFRTDAKFDSGTGWPSFDTPVEGALGTTEDRSHGMVRTEVHCARCGGHQGHVFPDGPGPSGLRYCINGVATVFIADPAAEKPAE